MDAHAVSSGPLAAGRRHRLAGSLGRTYEFGEASFLGNLASTRLASPIVSMSSYPR